MLKYYRTFLSMIVIAIAMSACAGQIDPADYSSKDPSPEQLMAAQATRTPVPTATVDFQATLSIAYQDAENERQRAYQAQQDALDAQETSIAANALIIGYTAQAESNLVTIAQITQEAMARAEVHTYETQTAQPTANAIQATAQAVKLAEITLQSGMLTANSPTGIKAKSDAEYSAQFGWVNYMATGLVSISLFFLVIWIVIYLSARAKKEMADAYNDASDEPYIIPMAEDADNPNQTLRAEIQCTTEQLVLLAKGWMENKKTPAFNKWRGTVVINALYEIREFLTWHKLTYELDGKRGELAYTERGRAFMEYTAMNGELPAPFVCVPSPLPSREESPKSTIIPLTGVPGQLS